MPSSADDFIAPADLTTALDNLIHRGEVPRFIAALTQPGERNIEHTGDTRHAGFLTSEVLPMLRERFPLRELPGARASRTALVDPWGHEWDHDWPTWRRMLPLYLDALTA